MEGHSSPSASVDARAKGNDLETVLERLQEAEINCWVGTAPPAHIAAALHDPAGGADIRTEFEPVDGRWPRGAIAQWLIATAERLYPDRLR